METLEIFKQKLDDIEEKLEENNVEYKRNKYQIQFEKWGLSFFMGCIFEEKNTPYRIKLENEDGKKFEREHHQLGEYVSVEFKENVDLSELDSENVNLLYVYYQSGIVAKSYEVPEKTAHIWNRSR